MKTTAKYQPNIEIASDSEDLAHRAADSISEYVELSLDDVISVEARSDLAVHDLRSFTARCGNRSPGSLCKEVGYLAGDVRSVLDYLFDFVDSVGKPFLAISGSESGRARRSNAQPDGNAFPDSAPRAVFRAR